MACEECCGVCVDVVSVGGDRGGKFVGRDKSLFDEVVVEEEDVRIGDIGANIGEEEYGCSIEDWNCAVIL